MSEHLSSLIIGSGFSGICMAIKLKKQGIHDFVILEKAMDIGGTWRENTYPGAECDVPSALYSFSFEPSPDWEYKWSHQPQILNYIRLCADKYELHPHFKFGEEMITAHWKEAGSYWEIKTKKGSIYTSRTLVTAIGQLHIPSTPVFPGQEDFKTVSFHSAKWNHDVALENKRIGVIGNGASAVQFVPQIAKVAKQVTVYQRSANWILPKQDRMYKEWEKKLVRLFPFLLKLYRLKIWLLAGGLFLLLKKSNHLLRKIYQRKTRQYINDQIDDLEMRAQLLPKYAMGAKRVLFSDDYYQALNLDHVYLNTSPIQRITATGIITDDGSEEDLDVLIYATGFKTNPFLMGLDIQNGKGQTIKEVWADGSDNYYGICVAGFANLFMMYGPNTNLGHNSVILMFEAQADYIVQCIQAIQKEDRTFMMVKESAIQAYKKEMETRINTMVWTTVENSWYRSASGQIVNNWPGRTIEYKRRLKKVNFDDFKIV